jgi:hypothetical protein
MADYRVRIGEFRVYVKVLNLHLNPILGKKIDEGRFGSILEKRVATTKFVAKIQKIY